MNGRIQLKKPTKNDLLWVQNSLENSQAPYAIYQRKRVIVLGVRREGLVIKMNGEKFIVPTKLVKLEVEYQMRLRTQTF